MNAPARYWLRAGLVLLTVLQAVVGGWQYFAPASFYTDVPTVAADPPYNEHLMTDVGGLGLALAAILGASVLFMERNLIRAALAGYLVYTVTHLIFHVTHLGGLPGTDAALLTTGLALLPAVAIGLPLLTARAPDRPGFPAEPRPLRRGSKPAGRGSHGRSS
jgi:hypothetical protein